MSVVPVYGVVAVIERDGCLLAIRRAEGIPAAGWWCLPGGAIEPGESEEIALIREVREELGLDVRPNRRVWEWQRRDGQLVLYWWRATLIDAACACRPDPGEVAEHAWLTPEQLLCTAPLLESNRRFLLECDWRGAGSSSCM